DDEVLLDDVAVDARRRIERNGLATELAIDLAVKGKLGGPPPAVDLSGLADGYVVAMDVTRNFASDDQRALAHQRNLLADNGEAGTGDGGGPRRRHHRRGRCLKVTRPRRGGRCQRWRGCARRFLIWICPAAE